MAGLRRDQIVMLDLAACPVAVTGWSTTRYQQQCAAVFATYLRDVDVSPDGSYFVVMTTGAYRAGSLCDAAARWETAATGPSQQPTWVDYTGGDTLYSVAITGTAVYVGGHQRRMNNSFAADKAGPGAVAREGIAALDRPTACPVLRPPHLRHHHRHPVHRRLPAGLPTGPATVVSGAAVDGRSWQSRA